jgi:hypothetical protein
MFLSVDPGDVDDQPSIRDLNVTRRTLALASADNAAAEDLLIKISRSVDVGTVMKCVTVNPSRRAISQLFCSIRTLLIDDSKSEEQCPSGRVAHTCLIFRRHQRKPPHVVFIDIYALQVSFLSQLALSGRPRFLCR